MVQQDRAGGRQSLLHKEVWLWRGVLFIAGVGGFPFECRTSHTEFPHKGERLRWDSHVGDTGPESPKEAFARAVPHVVGVREL